MITESLIHRGKKAMNQCKFFWNQQAPDDTRWVTLLDLCCQRKWLSSTVLFQQGFHMRNYTTDRRKFRSQTSDNMDRLL